MVQKCSASGRQDQRVKTARYGTGNRYRVRYEAPDGRERSESFPDRQKKAAENFLIDVESDKRRGSYIDPAAGRTLFGEFAEAWLRTHSFDESSRESTEIRVRKHRIPFFGKRQLAAILPSTIREWDSKLVGVLAPTTRWPSVCLWVEDSKLTFSSRAGSDVLQHPEVTALPHGPIVGRHWALALAVSFSTAERDQVLLFWTPRARAVLRELARLGWDAATPAQTTM